MADNFAKLKAQLLKDKIYEDQKILVLNKPTGLAVQGGVKIKKSVDQILNFGEAELKYRLTHRIDKDTSGLLLIAKSEQAAKYATKLFNERALKKTYLTIVVGKPRKKSGIIDLAVSAKKTAKFKHEQKTQNARSSYEIIDHVGNELSFLAVEPHTGRKHQIRIHLAAIGCPILGDGKYGGRQAFKSGLSNKIHLHAYQLILPNYFGKKPLKLEAAPPKAFQDTMTELGLMII